MSKSLIFQFSYNNQFVESRVCTRLPEWRLSYIEEYDSRHRLLSLNSLALALSGSWGDRG